MDLFQLTLFSLRWMWFLYPSIPHQDGLSALRTFLNDSRFDSRFIDGIVQLSEFILQHNVFVFDNQFNLQTKGTAIGTTMAVVYAVIFMHIFETGALSQSRLRPALWLRFIYDIFMVWPHYEASLADFVDYLNSILLFNLLTAVLSRPLISWISWFPRTRAVLFPQICT
jgi:hypothetical protein